MKMEEKQKFHWRVLDIKVKKQYVHTRKRVRKDISKEKEKEWFVSYINIKIITTIIRSELEQAEVIQSLHKKNHVLKLEIQRIATKMVPDLEDLTYEERLKEMHITTLKERRERGDLITIYKLMNNLEEKDRKDLLRTKKKRIGQIFEGTQEEIAKNKLFEQYTKIQLSQKKYRYLEWKK